MTQSFAVHGVVVEMDPLLTSTRDKSFSKENVSK